MKLYEIANEYEELLAAIEEGEIPEEAIADTLEAVQGMLEEKADNLACYIKNLLAEVKAIKDEEEKLAERRKAKEKRADQLKAFLGNALQRAGMTKLETARNKLSFRSSAGVVISDEETFIAWAEEKAPDLVKVTVAKKVALSAVQAAIKSGVEIEGAVIEQRQNLQIK